MKKPSTTRKRTSAHGNAHLVQWAEEIVAYYRMHRGAGSTYHQEHGWLTPSASPFPTVVVMPYTGSTPMLDAARAARCHTVPLSAGPLSLRGLNGPLLVEHSALALILSGLLTGLRRAEERAYRAKAKSTTTVPRKRSGKLA